MKNKVWLRLHSRTLTFFDAGLCGVHALNNLLQGSFYSEVDLMTVALALDQEEKNVMAEMGVDTKEFLEFVANDSSNVALDGNFSLQVLKKSLENMGLSTCPITHPDMASARENPQNEQAFICNLSSHWFSIRKISGQFWDLNSVHSSPKFLSELYLDVFLKQLQVEGYSIFVVRGPFPAAMDSGGRNWTRASGPKLESKPNRLREEAKQIEAAIEASLNSSDSAENDDIAAALALSLQTHPPAPPPIQSPKQLKPLPEEPLTSSAPKILVRCPDGTKIDRRFNVIDTLEDIFNWVFITKNVNLHPPTKHKLISLHPRVEYDDITKTLAELGWTKSLVLIIDD